MAATQHTDFHALWRQSLAQWKEMIADPEQKIGRPRQLYIGEKARAYVPLELRP